MIKVISEVNIKIIIIIFNIYAQIQLIVTYLQLLTIND